MRLLTGISGLYSDIHLARHNLNPRHLCLRGLWPNNQTHIFTPTSWNTILEFSNLDIWFFSSKPGLPVRVWFKEAESTPEKGQNSHVHFAQSLDQSSSEYWTCIDLRYTVESFKLRWYIVTMLESRYRRYQRLSQTTRKGYAISFHRSATLFKYSALSGSIKPNSSWLFGGHYLKKLWCTEEQSDLII